MRGDTFIKLGSSQSVARGAGNKGALLDRATKAGLKVPDGILLLDTLWDQAVLTGLITIDGANVHITDPARFIRRFQLPVFEKPVAVRSAFSTEDGDDSSLAGYFETVLHVDMNNPDDFASALERVIASAAKQEGQFRRDVLVMEMVEAKHAGVAFTEREHEDDLVNYVEDTAQDLVGGVLEGATIPLAKLRHWESKIPGETLEPWQARLQNLLRQIRRWLDDRDWDVEWADDGKRCYLVQLRPVTRPTQRNEAFTIANHKEILPELPSHFMTSIIESCAPELFAYYRNFDASLPESRPFIEVFYGRPYINLSLLNEMMRIFGLPTRLVTDNIGGGTDRTYGLNIGRMIRKIFTLTLPRFALAQLFSVRSARHKTEVMLVRTSPKSETFAPLVAQMRWLYTALVTEMFSLTAAIGPMLLLLRQAGTLEEHSARQQTISTRMYTDLDPLRELVSDNANLRTQLERGELPDDPEFRALWDDYIARYGHRGIYESDIARQRYHEDATSLLHSLTASPAKPRSKPHRTLKGLLTLPIWWQAGRTLHAREQWRHDAMIGFGRVRRNLITLAEKAVTEGQLPSVEALWLLHMDEVKQLDNGWSPDADFLQQRREEIDTRSTYHLPDLFRRFDNLMQYREDVANLEDHLHGISLTQGYVEGQAWVLREPASKLPAGFDPAHTVLIARSVDAGWIPTFSCVAGVAVETGGDLSHGSIILREIGLPAITNVHGATHTFETGDYVRLDARNGAIERINTPLVDEATVKDKDHESTPDAPGMDETTAQPQQTAS